MQTSSKAAKELFNDNKNLIQVNNGLIISEEALINVRTHSTLVTYAATAATKALSIVGNMILMLAFSTVLSKVFESIDNLIHAEEKAAEALENATSTAKKFKDSISDIQSSAKKSLKSVNDFADTYAKLAQGVDTSNNQNIQLSNKDYDEFLDLNTKLAELFPSLTKKYDENGNAILGLGGSIDNVKDKITSLVEQQEQLSKIEIRQNIESYVNGSDKNGGQLAVLEGLEKNFNDAETDLNKLIEKYNAIFNGEKVQEDLLNNRQVENAKQYYKDAFGLTEDELRASLATHTNFLGERVYIFDFKNLEIDEERKNRILTSYNSFYKTLNDNALYARSELEAANKEMSSMMMMWVEEEFFYQQSGETFQSLIQNIIGCVNWNEIGIDNFAEAKSWIQNNIFDLISSVGGDDKVEVTNALNHLFSLDLSKLTIEDAQAQISNYIAILESILGQETADKLKISLGLNEIDDLYSTYMDITNRAAKKFSNTSDDEVINQYGNYDLYQNEYNSLQEFAEKNSINTQDEIAFWNQCLDESAAKEEAMQEYLKSSIYNKSFSLSTVLTNSKEDTDSFTSSLPSAYDAYNTLLSPNVSSSDTLSSLIAMNDAVSGIGRKINWEFLGDIPETHRLESLGTVLDNIAGQAGDALKASLHSGNEAYDEFIDTMVEGMACQQQAASEFNNMNAQIDSLQSSYQTLSGILSSYNSTGYLTLDNLQSLLTADENLISMLEVEDGQLSINKTAYQNLVAVQLAELKTKLGAAAAEIEALAKNKTARATNANADASHSAVKELDAETDAFNRNTSAAIANAIATAEKEGVNEDDIRSILDKYNDIWDSAVKGFDSDFSSFMDAASSSASGTAERHRKRSGQNKKNFWTDISKLNQRGLILLLFPSTNSCIYRKIRTYIYLLLFLCI